MAKGRNTTIVAARISDNLNEAAIERAAALGLTLSELVGRALEEWLTRPEGHTCHFLPRPDDIIGSVLYCECGESLEVFV